MKAWIPRILMVGIVFLCAFPLFAQESSAPVADLKGDWNFRSPQPAGIKNLMLVDPSRLSVSHSVSMSYGMGSAYGPGGSSVTGLFLSHVNYRLADPLNLWVDVGVGFQPSLNMNEDGSARVVVPGFGLLYQPSDRFRLEVIVQNPNYYYNPYRYWRR